MTRTGLKRDPMRAVPCDWRAKSRERDSGKAGGGFGVFRPVAAPGYIFTRYIMADEPRVIGMCVTMAEVIYIVSFPVPTGGCSFYP
jgi:hypothetical protein